VYQKGLAVIVSLIYLTLPEKTNAPAASPPLIEVEGQRMPKRLLACLRRLALLRDGGGLSDGQLLAIFVKHRDGDAFEALVIRHGPMVMGVCRRVLRNQHDAEDAFQATFLIFARKAGSVNAQDSVAGWLYRVAYRTALGARARIARRRAKERQVNELPHPTVEPEDGHRELLSLLDKELDRLPDKYRVPVVLCELEGRCRKEAARLLGVPEGTLSWRLAQAKKLLTRRLSRYGIVAVAALLSESTASACLTPALRASTVKAVLSAGVVPAEVLALTEGVMKVMLLSKLKLTACAAALMVLAGVGATGLTYRATAEEPALESRQQADELEALRLEMGALRKSLNATRQRVKTLEGEVSALKGQSHGPQGMAPSGDMMPSGKGDAPSRGAPLGAPGGGRGGGPPSGEHQMPPHGAGMPGGMKSGMQGQMMQQMQKMMQGSMAGPPSMMQMRFGQGMGGMMRKATSDPVSDAEAALKKLRANPGDKKATEALERALKKLKEKEKPNLPGEGTP
jgi:RNA polymerase sigma factor (sigma-70 family)